MNNNLDEKKCNKCGVIKPLTDFYKSTNGYFPSCKQCHLCAHKIFYKKNKEKLQRTASVRHQELTKLSDLERCHKWCVALKLDVLTHYSRDCKLACVKCGFQDIRALSIDHIDGNGAEHRKSINNGVNKGGGTVYSWLKKNSYPEGYQTLCFNCQMVKRAENGEYCSNGRPIKYIMQEKLEV